MADDQHTCIGITEEQLRTVMRETVHETLLCLGIDTQNPLEMQKDFQSLREWRNLLTDARRKGTLAIIGLLVCTFVAFVIAEFKHVLVQ